MSKAKPTKKAEVTKEAPVAKEKVVKSADTGYGVAFLAEVLKLEPFTIRQKLRKAKIEKNGKSYTWATKKEAEEVAKQLKSVKLKNEE